MITKEHYDEFELYFDLVDVNKLNDKVVCDFGCGIGRWSKILIDKVNIKTLILLIILMLFILLEKISKNMIILFLLNVILKKYHLKRSL